MATAIDRIRSSGVKAKPGFMDGPAAIQQDMLKLDFEDVGTGKGAMETRMARLSVSVNQLSFEDDRASSHGGAPTVAEDITRGESAR
jgi:hypothetical protein